MYVCSLILLSCMYVSVLNIVYRHVWFMYVSVPSVMYVCMYVSVLFIVSVYRHVCMYQLKRVNSILNNSETAPLCLSHCKIWRQNN